MIRAGLLGRRAAVILMITAAAATVTRLGSDPRRGRTFPPRGEWQKKDPAAVGLDKAQARRGDRVCRRAREPGHEGPGGRDRESVPVRGPLQHAHRPDTAARRRRTA